MGKIRKIIKLEYTGPLDENGLPHGKGVMLYMVEPDPKDTYKGKNNLRYKGEFVHGLRHGDGDLHALGLIHNPVSEYEWYSEGDYDGCGRLIHPSNAAGTWEPHVQCWYPYFEGTWQDDMPLKSRWGSKISKSDMEYIINSRYDKLVNNFYFDFRDDKH